MGEQHEGLLQPWLCPKCGKEQSAGYKFCTTCGVDQSGNEAERRDNVVFGKLPTADQIKAAEERQKGK